MVLQFLLQNPTAVIPNTRDLALLQSLHLCSSSPFHRPHLYSHTPHPSFHSVSQGFVLCPKYCETWSIKPIISHKGSSSHCWDLSNALLKAIYLRGTFESRRASRLSTLFKGSRQWCDYSTGHWIWICNLLDMDRDHKCSTKPKA